ncbi:mechanosensitive ion channel domain-containing protein [Sporosarcina gallistercoris]|uniref:mechanosensitive ion channel family protein n=1 Tax=Sporosarcina gallistercoris TaxID=2762245 RepID=UPI003D2B7873
MPDFLKEYFLGIADSLQTTLKTPDAYLNKVALTAVVLVIGIALYMLLKKMLARSVKNFTKKIQLHKAAKQTMGTLTIVSVLFIWVQAINVLVLIALLFGMIAVFMVRGLTSNIIGYFVIKYRKYFEIGHRVEINEIIGDVIEINSTSFKLLEVRNGLSSDAHTGRIIKLPNSIIFNESIEMVGVANRFVWHEVKYVVSFDSNWQAAEQIMTEAGASYFEEIVLPELQQTNRRLLNGQSELRPVFSIDTNDAGIVLVLRYLVDYQQGVSAKTTLQRTILPQFIEHPNIEFAIVEVKVFQG